MPVDKFGRHLHQHQHPVDQSKVYLVENVSGVLSALKTDIAKLVKLQVEGLKYETMFYLMAVGADAKGRYKLFNSSGANFEYIYRLPRATIKSVSCTPPDSKIHINGVEAPQSALIGFTLKEGDKIHVVNKPNVKNVFACEFIMKPTVLVPAVYGF